MAQGAGITQQAVATPFACTEADGVLAGPVRRPANASKDAKGSIHDDATAQTLGFRGGTVAANIHFEQFPPLMEALFGGAWFRTGSLSLYFLTPTTDGEPVQAFARRPPAQGGQAEVWMEDAAGAKVCEGTATVGQPDLQSCLRRRLQGVRPAVDLRMLSGSRVGDKVTSIATRAGADGIRARLPVVTEPLADYEDPSIWGERMAPSAAAIDLMRAVEGPLFRRVTDYVGMFGAIEVQMLDGPVFADHDYLVDGEVLALSESPKTEIVWYQSTLKEPATSLPVARMILLSRLLKASSPLWT